jgi:hypothetical protein
MSGITRDREVPALANEIPGVLGKLEATRHAMRGYRFWLALASLLLAELALSAALILADWMWVLPSTVRALGLLAMAALVFVPFIRNRRRFGRDQAAAEVEAYFPELGQRVRTVVEYAAPGARPAIASPGLLRALGHDTEHRTAGLDFQKLIPWATFERRAVAFFFATVLGIVALFASSGLRTATLRMLLIPAHFTTLDVEPGDATLKAGDELALKVTLSGRPVSKAHWLYREKNSDRGWISAPLASVLAAEKSPAPLIGTLTAGLKDCQADLEYRVTAGELESKVFQVKVVHPLVLTGVEAAITPPAYTRRPREVAKQGNFKAIEGSSVQLSIALDHAPKSASLTLRTAGGQATPEMVPLSIEGAKLTAQLPAITADMQYKIDAVDDNGMNLETDAFRIKVVRDREPTLRFVQPDESLGVTPITEVPIQVASGDDFGVSRLGIKYKIGNGPEETLHLTDYKDQPVTADVLTTLYLEKHRIDFKDGISYYAFVEDNYPPEPHRVVSDLRFIDILPYKKEYQLVDAEEGPPPTGDSVTLEELIARQRVNLNRTFLMERDRSIAQAATMRLATFEEELAAATAEFSEGLRGAGAQIASLDEAVSAMRSAILALDKKDLPTARSHEEMALKGLIKARANLRTVFSKRGGARGRAARKFDREQVQKLRRPPEDQSKKELAELEEDLEELARKEEAFSEEIAALGGGGAKLDPPQEDQAQPNSSQNPSSESSKEPSANPATSQENGGKPRPDLLKQQKQLAEEAERIRRVAQKDHALTDLTRERLDEAAKLVQEANKALEAGREAEAAENARDAARKLEALARQVGALKAQELTDSLARERDMAQAIARAERELAKALEAGAEKEAGAESKEPGKGARSAQAGRQRELADDVAALADVLDRLRSGAALEERELAETVDQATRRNPPGEVEDAMRQNAQAITAGKTKEAARDASAAADRLGALAQDLESARLAAVQPQLERLLAAEKQAAALQEQLRSMRQPSQRAAVERAMSELAEAVDKLAPAPGSLQKAADNLRSAIMARNTGVLRPGEDGTHEPDGLFRPPVGYNDGLVTVMVALQAKIQQIILENALAERDGPVPPRYKEMVEDYYRVLSMDLR